MHPSLVATVTRSRILWPGMLIAAFLLLAYTALEFSFPTFLGKKGLVDFDQFYIVGQMYWSDLFIKAYQFRYMLEGQALFAGQTAMMLWSYPPPYGALVILLPALPIGAAYLVFAGAR